MIALIVFLLTIAVIIVLIFLTINTSRNNANSVEIEMSEFKRMLKTEGLSDELIEFSMLIVQKVQEQEEGTTNDIISNNVLKKLNGWEYSNVLNENDYEVLYSKHSVEIDKIHGEFMNDHGFVPLDVGESKHTENWSQEAQYAELALTQKISNIAVKYRDKMNQMV